MCIKTVFSLYLTPSAAEGYLQKTTSRNICRKNNYVQLFSAPCPSKSSHQDLKPSTLIAENGSRRSGRILFN